MSNWEMLFFYWSAPGIIGAAIMMLLSGEWKLTIWSILYCLFFGSIFGGLAAVAGIMAIPIWCCDNEKVDKFFNRIFLK